ncbi:MAG: hydroxyacid dehydrogenase [Planctomycetota bacterium]|nr:MAG: hydroxyacid dehydrogenase [Planctomycetota bacterium]
MKVLIADKLPASALTAFGEAGFEVLSEPALKDEALTARVASSRAEVLVVRSTKVDRATLEAGCLGLVVRAGAGVNTIDVAAASQLGVYVANCPGKNAVAVAELTWGLLVGLDRRIPDATRDLRAGRWNKKEYGRARGLWGRTLGVVGVGAIGREVIARAKAFGMPVVAWSRSLDAEAARAFGVERAESPVDVAARSDAVSIHLALTDATRGCIGAEFFAALRPGALFVNTSRGAVVDAEALRIAVEEKGIRAGLDVWAEQPATSEAEFSDPLAALPGVCGTPHIGASTEQAQDAVAAEALRVARTYKETGEVPNCVNLGARSATPAALVVRHRDRVGVLAYVLAALREAGINVQEMRNVLFSGDDGAACATIRLAHTPAPEVLTKLNAHDDVIEARIAL